MEYIPYSTVMEKASPLRSSLCGALVAVSLVAPVSAGVIINDGMTSSGNYFETIIQSTTAFNNSYADLDSTGDETLLLSHVHDVSREDETGFPVSNDPMDITSLVRFSNFYYNPSVSGNIETLTFRLEYRTSHPLEDVFFFVENSGGNGALAGFTPVVTSGDWNVVEVSGLTDANFLNIGFSGSQPLRFGFGFTSAASFDPGNTESLTYEVELDNFSVTVVPEPGSALALLGSSLLLLRRKRNAA
ncbi:MAG: PEP-CTERM sorting domain-containing protein [Verrucomicrobiaceae bacterium]|nr:MAG: PEP-CTERM sorting domain-containing protein [Verrucomicrobiaceae bacterium]